MIFGLNSIPYLLCNYTFNIFLFKIAFLFAHINDQHYHNYCFCFPNSCIIILFLKRELQVYIHLLKYCYIIFFSNNFSFNIYYLPSLNYIYILTFLVKELLQFSKFVELRVLKTEFRIFWILVKCITMFTKQLITAGIV